MAFDFKRVVDLPKMPLWLGKLLSYEYWPIGLFYIPIGIYIFCLALQARSLTFFTNVNPFIKDSGIYRYKQIDAIRSLGADPLKKLVLPRLLACTVVMPLLCSFALVLGFCGAMFITAVEFNVPAQFFLRTALSSVIFRDVYSGMFKCPFYGAIIAIVGCHFGLITRGGTEGVGQSTTAAVVTTSISVLVADFLLTKVSFRLWPALF